MCLSTNLKATLTHSTIQYNTMSISRVPRCLRWVGTEALGKVTLRLRVKGSWEQYGFQSWFEDGQAVTKATTALVKWNENAHYIIVQHEITTARKIHTQHRITFFHDVSVAPVPAATAAPLFFYRRCSLQANTHICTYQFCISFHHFNVYVENFPCYVPLYLYVCWSLVCICQT